MLNWLARAVTAVCWTIRVRVIVAGRLPPIRPPIVGLIPAALASRGARRFEGPLSLLHEIVEIILVEAVTRLRQIDVHSLVEREPRNPNHAALPPACAAFHAGMTVASCRNSWNQRASRLTCDAAQYTVHLYILQDGIDRIVQNICSVSFTLSWSEPMVAGSAAEVSGVPHPSLGSRLHALRLERGWNMDRVAAAAGISRTTLFHLGRDEINQPRASTLHKLARAFDVPIGHFGFRISDFGSGVRNRPDLGTDGRRAVQFRNPKSEIRNEVARRAFDRATNPIVSQIAADDPQLFDGWSADDWDELYSQFATGGALREEGVRQTAARINHDRETLYRLRIVLQTHLSDVAAGMVDTLYRLVSIEPSVDPNAGAGDDDP
jgi:transcriptional regulator with XRE-family HTH domain